MAQAAARRRREEWLMFAQVIAAGTASGFSGKSAPIEGLARALGIPYPGGVARRSEVGDIVRELYATKGGSGGDNGRRTLRRT